MEPITSPIQSSDSSKEPAEIRPVVTEHIGVRPGYCGGKPHIIGHRINVEDVATWYEKMGKSPAQIVARYPTITLAQLHAALAYYYDHREEIETDIREGDEFIEKLRAGQPSIFEKARQRSDHKRAGADLGDL